MFIAHLPAGTIAARLFQDRRARIALLVGSVLPDIDLVYFYGFSDRSAVHHSYATHTPLFWAALCVLAVLLSRLPGLKAGKIAAGFFLGVLLHLVLDTVAGGVEWLWPFSAASYVLTDVPARHHLWVLNFLLHWTFGLELAICVVAAFLFLKDRGLRTAPRSG